MKTAKNDAMLPAPVEIINMLSDAAGIEKIGTLSPDVGFAVRFSGGRLIKLYRDGSALLDMNVRIEGQGQDQLKVACRLFGICDSLAGRNFRTFPKTDRWELRSISAVSPPAPKELGKDGRWFYECVVSVNYFLKPYPELQ